MALTSRNAPRPADHMVRGQRVPEELQDSVVARPLTLPNFAELRPKLTDRSIEFRWANYAVPTERGGFTSLRLDQLVAAGFVYAKPDDVDGGCPPSLVMDGKIKYGDLVLLKIDRGEYHGALKDNWERAIQRGSRTADFDAGRSAVTNAVRSDPRASARPDLQRKIGVFQPTDAQLAAVGTGGNVSEAAGATPSAGTAVPQAPVVPNIPKR